MSKFKNTVTKDLSLLGLDADFYKVCGKEYPLSRNSSFIIDGVNAYSYKKKGKLPVDKAFVVLDEKHKNVSGIKRKKLREQAAELSFKNKTIADFSHLDIFDKSIKARGASTRKSYRDKTKTLVFVRSLDSQHLYFVNPYFYSCFRRKRAYMRRQELIKPEVNFNPFYLKNKLLYRSLFNYWFRIFFKRNLYTMRGIPMRYFFYIRIFLARHLNTLNYFYALKSDKGLNNVKFKNFVLLNYLSLKSIFFKPSLDNLILFCFSICNNSSKNKQKIYLARGKLLRRNKKKKFSAPIKQTFD